MFQFINDIQQISRYSLSTGVRQEHNGLFRSAVSIKSGAGAHSHDSVYTFTRLFNTAQEALDHALHEGMQLAVCR